MAPVRSLTTLFLPGGLLVLAGLILFRPGILPDALQPYVQAYPYVVFGVGVVMAWYFNRSRIVFALLILTVSAMALYRVGDGYAGADRVSRVVFAAVAMLLPLNLAAFAVLKERGVFTVRGVSRLIAIAAQVLAVDLTIRLNWSAAREWLTYAFADEWLMAWTSLPQASLAVFGVAAAFLTAHSILRRDPSRRVSFGRSYRHSPRCRECAGDGRPCRFWRRAGWP